MKTRAFIYIIIAGLLWGTSGLFVHVLSPYGFSSLQMSAMRGVVSALCMIVYALVKDRSLFCISKRELALFAASGVGIFGTATSYYVAMQLTSVSTAVVLMYTAPVIVMVYSVLVFGEKMTTLKGVSVGNAGGMLSGIRNHRRI